MTIQSLHIIGKTFKATAAPATPNSAFTVDQQSVRTLRSSLAEQVIRHAYYITYWEDITHVYVNIDKYRSKDYKPIKMFQSAVTRHMQFIRQALITLLLRMGDVDPETLLEWLQSGAGEERDMQLIALEQVIIDNISSLQRQFSHFFNYI